MRTQLNHRHKIQITEHARLRLRERMGNKVSEGHINHYVQKARYEGTPVAEASPQELKWMYTHLSKKTKHRTVRFYDNFCFIFGDRGGHYRTLITVISMT